MERVSLIVGFACLGIIGSVVIYVFLLSGPAGWQDRIASDHARNEVTYDFRLPSIDGDSELSMTCRPNERIRAVLFTDRLGPSGSGEPLRAVRVRLDQGQPVVRRIVVSEGTIALTDPDDPASSDFISSLAGSRRFEVELAAPSGGARFVAAFHTIGADDVVADLRQNCI
ncbi:hypothetical protein RCO27_17105 [Sphingosinicella sp. LHD-64]|uniref:hypothetical protein n=1 Tax=Sphingosinicella sp. LHD-64 TaxID=3072139 RepID=UPI00280F8EB8|nr:hypothetical protein [Sphingosinicella sp. LHD-64]MDQ8757946.1 hypothetical protein [Sphingosinicella sp. LHD-64]